MLRAIEFQLLASSVVSGAVAALVLLPRRAGVVVVSLGLGVAAAVDEEVVRALPPLISVPAPYLATACTAALVLATVAGGPLRPTRGPGWLAWPFALVAAVGVYVAVPETSYALLVVGVLGGISAVGAFLGEAPGPGLCAGLAAAPVLGVAFGCSVEPQALAGGLLACAPGLLLGVVSRPRSLASALAIVGFAAVASFVAARGLAITRTWEAAPVVVVVVVLALGGAVFVDRHGR